MSPSDSTVRIEIKVNDSPLLLSLYVLFYRLSRVTANPLDPQLAEMSGAYFRLEQKVGYLLYRRMVRRGVAALFEVQ